jgi:hypothetical protein
MLVCCPLSFAAFNGFVSERSRPNAAKNAELWYAHWYAHDMH